MPILPPPHAPRAPSHGPLHAPPVLIAKVDPSAYHPFDSSGPAPRRTPIPKRANSRPSPTSAARVAQAPPRARIDVSSLSPSPGVVANIGGGAPRLRSRRSITSLSSVASPAQTSSPSARPGVRKAQSSTLLRTQARAAPPVLPPLPPLPCTPPSPAQARSRTLPRPLSPQGLAVRTSSFPGPLSPAAVTRTLSVGSGLRSPTAPVRSSTTLRRSPSFGPRSPQAPSSVAGASVDPENSPPRSRIPIAVPAPARLRRSSSLASAPSSVSSGNSKPLASIPQDAPLRQRVPSASLLADQPCAGPDSDVGGGNDVEEEAKKARKILDLEISNRSLLTINEALEVTKLRQAEEIRELKRRLRAGVGLGPDSALSASSKSDMDEREDEEEEDPVLAALNGRCATLVEQMTSRARTALAFEPAHGHVGTGGKVLHPCEVAGLLHNDPAQAEQPSSSYGLLGTTRTATPENIPLNTTPASAGPREGTPHKDTYHYDSTA